MATKTNSSGLQLARSQPAYSGMQGQAWRSRQSLAGSLESASWRMGLGKAWHRPEQPVCQQMSRKPGILSRATELEMGRREGRSYPAATVLKALKTQ